jgi:hypothetical protein
MVDVGIDKQNIDSCKLSDKEIECLDNLKKSKLSKEIESLYKEVKNNKYKSLFRLLMEKLEEANKV